MLLSGVGSCLGVAEYGAVDHYMHATNESHASARARAVTSPLRRSPAEAATTGLAGNVDGVGGICGICGVCVTLNPPERGTNNIWAESVSVFLGAHRARPQSSLSLSSLLLCCSGLVWPWGDVESEQAGRREQAFTFSFTLIPPSPRQRLFRRDFFVWEMASSFFLLH